MFKTNSFFSRELEGYDRNSKLHGVPSLRGWRKINRSMRFYGIRKAQELVGGEAQDILYFAKFRTI